MNIIFVKISKQSGLHYSEVEDIANNISRQLTYEGCVEDDPRFIQYLVRRLRKQLGIEESTTYKSFKQFFQK